MSRIGNKPIAIPAGVTVKIENNLVTVSGSQGELKQIVDPKISVAVADNEIVVTRKTEQVKAKHGLYRALIANMVEGLSKGFKKTLIINGVGYKVAKTGNKLIFNIGFSHSITVEEVPGITLTANSATEVTVSGINKELVGQVAAKIRGLKPVEPYHNYGIRYSDEKVVKKEGKKAGKK